MYIAQWHSCYGRALRLQKNDGGSRRIKCQAESLLSFSVTMMPAALLSRALRFAWARIIGQMLHGFGRVPSGYDSRLRLQ